MNESLSEVSLFVEVCEKVEMNWLLRFNVCIVALIKGILQALLISLWGNTQHASPCSIIFTVRESEDVVLAYKYDIYNVRLTSETVESILSVVTHFIN